ncbi:glyoxylase I 4 [Amaranthus tricolor]|uniref:glyoxylase I 4 n=1 Tax=Amaranthus tricolor TaxID=29722 RepID=UPI00258E1ACE|nr:glyoxylase I 4 [Amaranthus tricolor]XP_057537786.1 glyoxylase I 4 [Amaranthus tricolor]XP_057537787.1 glyoxylase I 4 [Amaranthus tricolor]
MASFCTPSLTPLQTQIKHHNERNFVTTLSVIKTSPSLARRGRSYGSYSVSRATSIERDALSMDTHGSDEKIDYGVVGMHHVGILCENLERSLEFYQNILGLEINEARPHDKLPYRGAWLWVGSEMIHLMELPNPDPLNGRPEHGGRDRHACVQIRHVSNLKDILDRAGIPYTLSRSGRPAIFFRDPDSNALEFAEFDN